MRLRVAIGLSALVWLAYAGAVAIHAQGTILFEMDLTSPDSYGFPGANPTNGSGQALNNGVYYTYTHRATAGPQSTPAAELAMIAVTPPVAGGNNPCSSQPTCQDYAGWGGNLWTATIAQGSSLYVRLYFRVSAWNDPRSFDGGTWGGKMMIIGDGCSDDTNRAIWNIQSDETGAGSEPQWEIDKNVQGVGINNNLPNDGQWHAYQVRFQTSSNDATADGRIQYWEDNDDVNSPTQNSVTTFVWDSDCISGPSGVNNKMGGYMDWVVTTAGGQVATYQFAALEYATGFDPNWFANMGEAAPEEPATPYRFRFRTALLLWPQMRPQDTMLALSTASSARAGASVRALR